ncbi:ABC-three component system protein [Yersinia similis]|uniref:SMEK domain-containing protein n=1 Tax=Yersinia similis TaxID=367190 RepID=A0A0T9RRE2_9GAMM|nr:ABC-three component system protein [Yersinia similis]AHK19987.1 hypothetical protein BF17_12200 [Yersinia similis]CFQ73526.1 Uncharacterised protein [Yersinia similis]CNG63712.1 Uncharacterised protein [Yersinia similis]CNI79197.1 Uncharacterised protein [Yersinia similis]
MNRSVYFDLCERRLSLLCYSVEIRGKLNILNFNLHCEDFYVYFFNLLFGYSLENTNQQSNNFEGIDLIDQNNKIVLQVSATATKAKIDSALTKNLSVYKGHQFKFISIAKDASELRSKIYKNPHALVFAPIDDIHDVKTLLNFILHLDISKQKEVYGFLRRELEDESSNSLSETNIAAIINALAKEDFTIVDSVDHPKAFDVEKKIVFNNLNAAEYIIEDYKIHHSKVSHIYSEFDQMGKNVSVSVLASFRSCFSKLSMNYSGDELFFKVIESSIEIVKKSANFSHIPLEELELCVSILAVDAFIRCRIFKDPNGVNDVTTERHSS